MTDDLAAELSAPIHRLSAQHPWRGCSSSRSTAHCCPGQLQKALARQDEQKSLSASSELFKSCTGQIWVHLLLCLPHHQHPLGQLCPQGRCCPHVPHPEDGQTLQPHLGQFSWERHCLNSPQSLGCYPGGQAGQGSHTCRELTCSVQSSPQAISASPFTSLCVQWGHFLLSNLIHVVPITRDSGWKVPKWEEITALSCYFLLA